MTDFQQIEILLVEDNPRDAELALRSLRKRNLANQVHWVKDGAEALEFMFREGAYAARNPSHSLKLVLLDLKMPKVDGIEVLRRLKSDERTRATPVVVMTSSSEERDLVESYRLGANSYIVKPVRFEAFLDTVAEIGLYWVIANRTSRGTNGEQA
ncbi:MAG: response regulator [Burkholderiales bacterium]